MVAGMRHPVDTVTEPEPAEILGRVHSPAFCGWAAGGARRVSRHPIRLQKRNRSPLLENIKQNGDYADIACMTGSRMITITNAGHE